MNIFSELQRYKPHEYLTPGENFFTESFKVILNKFPALAKQVFEMFLDKELSSTSDLTLSSQKKHGSGSCVVDLEVSNKNKPILLVEIKLDAKEGNNQLSRYCKLGKGKVVYITKHFDAHVGNISHFYWSQIYEVIQTYIEKNSNSAKIWLLEEFLEFMEEKNMSGFKGLKTRSNIKWEVFVNDVYKPHTELFKQIREKLNSKYVCDKMIKEYFDEVYPFHIFYFYPKHKISVYKKAGIYPYCSLYLNSRTIADGDKDFLEPEGVYLAIGVQNKKLDSKIHNGNKKTIRGLIRTEKLEGAWLSEALLEEIILKESSAKGQLSKIYQFCDDAIRQLNKEFKNNNIKIKI